MQLALVPVLAGGLFLATLLTIHLLPQLASVLLLIFAGIVLAVMLNALTSFIQRFLPGHRHWLAYLLMLLLVVLVIAGIGMIVGPRIATEIPTLVDRIPQAWDNLIDQLNDLGFIDSMRTNSLHPLQWLTSTTQITNLLSSTFGALFNIFVVVFVGVYGAATPGRYLHVSRFLLPPHVRSSAASLSRDLGRELRHWMIGRAASMIIVGLATGVGLWLLGVPLAFTLGLFAGLISFVPYIGPILGLIPAVLIAALQSLILAVWVLVLYAIVQLVETTLLTPLIQQRAIALPPVILISAQLIGGTLIGPLGVLLAAPLVVCTMVTVHWYRRDVEGETAA